MKLNKLFRKSWQTKQVDSNRQQVKQQNVQVAKQSTKKLRSKLPDDFREILERGDVAEIKASLANCELNAYGYSDKTALAFTELPSAVMQWLVARGADIDAQNTYGNTPLHEHSSVWHGQQQLLIDLGAQINCENHNGETPLHMAAETFKPENVQRLLAAGANVNATDHEGQTPLTLAFVRCPNANISELAEITELLLASGATVDKSIPQLLHDIGENFERYRDRFDKDYVGETDAALQGLYARFNVIPVEPHQMLAADQPIMVKPGRWQNQHKQLWDVLVPVDGSASTIQGEVIRITSNIGDEVDRNGGMNWDEEYQAMLVAMGDYLASGKALADKDLKLVTNAIQDLDTGQDYDAAASLSELAVKWVKLNPTPIKLEAHAYQR
ncbi:ankyrin repeat domain-containing protein [Lactiplantibacillus herbarum]|uniref:ankyrin repeat domain-containing protein n=1 Tax=Lactiplantibacillus herbarum TaxID=1670446 RepID=UPI00069D6947|nr:ankyrin repeat domain-containing protein [Lactiplantibacillus herbarum]